MARKKTKKTSSKSTRTKKPAAAAQKTIKCITDVADRVQDDILKGVRPEMKFPIRALSNVIYDLRKGYFQMGRARTARSMSVNTVKSFAQCLRMMAMSKELVEKDDFATKREAYYISKNWQEAKFNEQPESDTVMDDIEAMFSLNNVSREELRFYPEEHGGAVAGSLLVYDPLKEDGKPIDCTQFGSGAYTIPSSVEHLRFKTKARFILAIEVAGMFQRLNHHRFWDKHNCILVAMSGVPTRATRRFIRRLSDMCTLPVYAFVDCDPYGFSNIYRTLKVGSGNAAHVNQFFSVPRARFLGVTPQDIVDYKLEPATHKLQDVDIKRAKDALKNDPFFQKHTAWQKAITQLLKMGVRAEQQALAMWGLNFVIDEYLPRKLKAVSKFLP